VAQTIGEYAFDSCDALETVSLPEAQSIGDKAFRYTGGQALEITLGSAGNPAAPELGTEMFGGVYTAKTVTVLVPSGATGYGPIPATYSGSGATPNWGNAFRGMGWNSTDGYGSGTLNSLITLDIRYIPGP
jgi:hypothetical protein